MKDLLIKYIDLRFKKLDKLYEITNSDSYLSQRWELQQIRYALVTNSLELEVKELELLFKGGE